MVPYGVFWQSVGCFFTEDFGMTVVFPWDSGFCFGRGDQSNGYLANIILIVVDGLWDVLSSWEEAGFLCVG